MALANGEYTQAKDPPDPNFTELVDPTVHSIAEFDELPPGPWKDYAEQLQVFHALKQAEATSRDRAIGAAEASDSQWIAAQWIHASDLAGQAAIAEMQLVGMESLWFADGAQNTTGLGSEIIASLESDGLSDIQRRILQELGWSDTEIENVRQNLIGLGTETLDTLTPDPLLRQATALVSSFSAMEDLRIGIEARVEQLEEEVRDLTSDERQMLNDLLSEVELALAKPVYDDAAFDAIIAYIAAARSVAKATNNFDAVKDDLGIGYAALTIFPQGTVSGHAFLDANDNGRQDEGEFGLENAQFTLLDAEGTVVATATPLEMDLDGDGQIGSSERGMFQFAGITPGTYFVATPANGCDKVTTAGGGTRRVEMTVNGRLQLDFGIQELAAPCLGDRVWHDFDGDGRQDPGESGLAGVVVELVDTSDGIVDNGDDTVVAMQTSDANGHYLFAGVEVPKHYYIQIHAPAESLTSRNSDDDERDSDADPATGRTDVVLLANTLRNVDAGLRDPQSPWRNPITPVDVNGNSSVEPLDVLNVINELNNPNFSGENRELMAAEALAGFPGLFFDVSADGYASPLDALIVINFLNRVTAAEEAEGRLTSSSGMAIVDVFQSPAIYLPTVTTMENKSIGEPPARRGNFPPAFEKAELQQRHRHDLHATDDRTRDELLESIDAFFAAFDMRK